MTQEEKQLLLIDLCARLPYGVICEVNHKEFGRHKTETMTLSAVSKYEYFFMNDKGSAYSNDFKPYLRPMSSMTEEEKNELCELCEFYEPYNDRDDYSHYGIEIISEFCVTDEKIPENTINYNVIDWLLSHHFDYRRLIEKGLALEAPEGMYKVKKI